MQEQKQARMPLAAHRSGQRELGHGRGATRRRQRLVLVHARALALQPTPLALAKAIGIDAAVIDLRISLLVQSFALVFGLRGPARADVLVCM